MINNPTAFSRILPANYSGLFKWDYISRVLPGREYLTDIDGALHKRGWFLFFETKHGYGEVERGPAWLFKDLIRQGQGYNELLVLYGKDEFTLLLAELWKWDGNSVVGIGEKFSMTADQVCGYVDNFRQRAISNPRRDW